MSLNFATVAWHCRHNNPGVKCTDVTTCQQIWHSPHCPHGQAAITWANSSCQNRVLLLLVRFCHIFRKCNKFGISSTLVQLSTKENWTQFAFPAMQVDAMQCIIGALIFLLSCLISWEGKETVRKSTLWDANQNICFASSIKEWSERKEISLDYWLGGHFSACPISVRSRKR